MDGIRTTEGWVPNQATQSIFGRVRMEDFVTDVDWDEAARRFAGPEIPVYVRSSIHGLEGGYSTPFAASTWDPVVKEIFSEFGWDEAEVRDGLASLARTEPRRILDVACGTGESTLAWRRRFPGAEITAIDVSPYMLAVAERKLADRRIDVRCADAERLPFEDGSFDLVTASLLFHEMPEKPAARALAEMRRVARPGGEICVLEPYNPEGRSLHPIPFPEPYLKEFLRTDWDVAFKAAGFEDVECVQLPEGWIRRALRPAA